jgi:hypothetical protein
VAARGRLTDDCSGDLLEHAPAGWAEGASGLRLPTKVLRGDGTVSVGQVSNVPRLGKKSAAKMSKSFNGTLSN